METISPAVIADADAISKLVNMAYRGDSGRQGWTTEADLIDGTRTDAELLQAVIQRADSVILKYVQDNEITGCVELRLEGDKLYLGMLTVKPTLQGGGIGKRLMQAAEAYAREKGCKAIFMNVLTDRAELIAWYERQGYYDTGARKPFAFTDPRFGQPKKPLEFMIMEKKLK
ncbi:MAG: GNAT family N-acetyltransferase [Cyclobacteriaceae bacterium]|nr:GNAT family N-acetyltransferase [Cyclobacteriaceae bacterium]